ncbi:hypothetical protein RJ639_037510 [Escallonia herrerae]|uniref:Uncharacterized protein n=1 Tax=Escallonia herrerae TaxID=1293975 RepID=A0AA89B4U5_9ASTE|nr:hypothetical protein RJ639_037510 [Escallonia herrerae]
MGTNNGNTDHKSRYQHRSNASFALGKGAAEDNERRIGGAEEVEEEPGGEEAEEGDEGERVGEERQGEHAGDRGQVVDPEVGVVFSDPSRGVGYRVGLGEGGAVGELGPGAAL